MTKTRKLISWLFIILPLFWRIRVTYVFSIVDTVMQLNCTLFIIAKSLPLWLNSCSQGLVVVWELNQERRGKPEQIYVSSEHKGRRVTALCWDTAILRVFVGDHAGKVSAIKLSTSKQAKVRSSPILCVYSEIQGVVL